MNSKSVFPRDKTFVSILQNEDSWRETMSSALTSLVS